jgi:type I restriction enzyme S subunit
MSNLHNNFLDAAPADWTIDRLKDVAAINASSLPGDTDPDYEFDYLEISNVDHHGIIDPSAIERLRFEDAPSRARRRTGKNCTIISSVRPNLQAVAFLQGNRENLICSTGFNVVEPILTKLSQNFAYYTLISERARQYFEASAKGVGYPAVDDKDFNSFTVPLPPLPEQEMIAAYLNKSCSAINEAVEAKRKQVQLLRDLRESIIETAVTRGIKPSHSFSRVEQDWIDQLPSHWSVCRIKRVISRMDYGISESTERDGNYAVLKMGNIQKGEIQYSNLQFVENVSGDLLLSPGDLLFNRTNSPDQVGKAAVFRGSKSDQMTFASYLVRLRTNHRANPYFLNYVLNCSGFLGFARKMAIPSVQQSNLNSTRYGRLFIPLPPVPEQNEIASFLDQKTLAIKQVIADIENQIATITEYRKSLIHEYVTGQRRVTHSDLEHTEAYA